MVGKVSPPHFENIRERGGKLHQLIIKNVHDMPIDHLKAVKRNNQMHITSKMINFHRLMAVNLKRDTHQDNLSLIIILKTKVNTRPIGL